MIKTNIPWFFLLYDQIMKTEFKLGVLLDLDVSCVRGKYDQLDSECRYFCRIVDLSKLHSSNKFFWIVKEQTHINPEPKPKGWWKQLFYQESWMEKTLLGNLEIKEDYSVEVLVYGEEYLKELIPLFESLPAMEGKDITIDLRTRTPLAIPMIC